MEMAGASSPQVLRKLNARRVLEHAWRADAFTASDVMTATGLTRSTVIGVCDELVRQGWLVELVDARAVGDYTKGRPARRYALRDLAGLVMGSTRATSTSRRPSPTCEVDPSVARRWRSPRSARIASSGWPTPRPAARSRSARCAMRSDPSGAPASAVLAVTVSVPAPVDRDGASPADDVVLATHQSRLPRPLRAARRVAVENDANLAAIAEQTAPGGAGTTPTRTSPSWLARASARDS